MRANNLEVRDRGASHAPQKLRDSLHLEKGDALRGVQVGDAIVLIPQRMELDNLRKQIRRLMKQRGVTARELAQGFVTVVPRVFLDSNVLISALIGEADSPPVVLVDWMGGGQLGAMLTGECNLREVERNLSAKLPSAAPPLGAFS